MLFYLTNKNGAPFYLLPSRSYSVGRKESDLLIAKDESISRKHAVLAVTEETVSLTDLGSKYGTFVDGKKLRYNNSVVLTIGCTIKFGMLTSVYNFNGVAVITTMSSIKKEEKKQLKQNISFLGGSLLQNWSNECTHVTVEELMLTVKVLSAIITGVPIVKLKYWVDYVECVKNNQCIPNPLEYTPKCSEVVLNDNISLEYKEERKSLFKNKIFVFSLKDNANMNSIIKLAGGESICWDTNHLTIDEVTNETTSEYIIVQSGEIADAVKDKTLLDFITSYNQTGKRTIPLQEIALAIINCSSEKDCNPKFNRKACLFKSRIRKPDVSEDMLAMPTQSDGMNSIPLEYKSELIIPESFDNDLNVDLVSKIEVNEHSLEDSVEESKINNSTPIVVDDTSSSLKRESESNHIESESKKIKTEEHQSFERIDKSIINMNPISSGLKQESSSKVAHPVAPGKSLFAFKHEKITSGTSDSTNFINPFAKKRKADLDDTQNPFKKPALRNETLSLTSSEKSNSSLLVNPFSNILKSKQSTQKDSSKITSTPKEKSNSRTSSKNANSLEIDFSAITAVDSNLEKSFGWISKSDGKSSIADLSSDKEDDSMDKDLLIFINSFRNAVIVEKDKDLLVRKSGDTIIANASDENGVKNYKKFRKVQPLRMQTVIVPESRYVSIVCDHNNEHEYVQSESEEELDTIDIDMPKGRKKGKQYTF